MGEHRIEHRGREEMILIESEIAPKTEEVTMELAARAWFNQRAAIKMTSKGTNFHPAFEVSSTIQSSFY